MTAEAQSLRPIGDKIVLRPEPKETKIGSIIIPDSAQKSAGYARVVALGPGMLTKHGRRWPMPDVRKGQRVVITAGLIEHGSKVKIDGVDHLVVRDDDILAVFDD